MPGTGLAAGDIRGGHTGQNQFLFSRPTVQLGKADKETGKDHMMWIITADIRGIRELREENQALTGGLGEGLPSWPGLTLEEGLETAELSWLVQAARVTSKGLFYLPANSEIIAKNYSVLNACQALLSCFTLIFFTPHGNPICLPETCSTGRWSRPPNHMAGKGKSRLAPGRRPLPCTPPPHWTASPPRNPQTPGA